MLTIFLVQYRCLELIQEDKNKLELAQLDQIKKEVALTKLVKDAAVKVKAEDDKLVKDVVVAWFELATELQRVKDKLVDLKGCLEVVAG